MEYKFTGRIQGIIPQLFNLDVDKEWDVVIKPHKANTRRSLNANNYAWHLIGLLANALKMPKESVYLQMLYDYGTSQTLTLKKGADLRMFEKCYTKTIESNDLYDVVAICVGSSNYTAEEMNKFISGIVEECRNLEIDTEWQNQ